jgi:hypothetical protein
MNTTEAESLLRCHREGREPDGRVQKALRVAEGDAELGGRLREQLEFDAQITEAIHYIIPPEDLRAKLGALSEANGHGKRGWRGYLSSPAMLAAVAGVLLFLGVIGFFVMESVTRFTGREAVEEMLAATAKMTGTEFEAVNTATAQLGDWFYVRGYEGYEALPELATVPAVGARVFKQNGKPVAQFVIEQHASVVFEFHAADFNVQLPPDGDWQVLEKDGWVAAIRQQGEHCLMIAQRGDEAGMRQFLKSLPKK